MDCRRFLTAAGMLATAGVAALAGCSAPTGEQRIENASFEDGLEGWETGREHPADPNTGDPVATTIAASDERASDGSRSVSLFIDGRQDDGVVWVEQAVDLRGVDALSVDVWSPEESFNTITKVAVYAGPDPERGLTEGDFDTTQAVEDHGGWKTYEYPLTHDGEGLVAVGIAVVWETEVTRYIDDVRLATRGRN